MSSSFPLSLADTVLFTKHFFKNSVKLTEEGCFLCAFLQTGIKKAYDSMSFCLSAFYDILCSCLGILLSVKHRLTQCPSRFICYLTGGQCAATQKFVISPPSTDFQPSFSNQNPTALALLFTVENFHPITEYRIYFSFYFLSGF